MTIELNKEEALALLVELTRADTALDVLRKLIDGPNVYDDLPNVYELMSELQQKLSAEQKE